MRKLLVRVVALLLVGVSAEAASAASSARYDPKLVFVGAFQLQPDGLSWTIRGIGVNSSYGVVLQVTFRSSYGSDPVVLAPVTLKFSSGAGNAQWDTTHYDTPIPPNATVVGADVVLINLKKPTIPLDHRYAERPIGASFVGNLYCDPAFYPGIQCWSY